MPDNNLITDVREVREDLIRIKSFIGSELGYENETRGNVGFHIDRLNLDLAKLEAKAEFFDNFEGRLSTLEKLMRVLAGIGGLLVTSLVAIACALLPILWEIVSA